MTEHTRDIVVVGASAGGIQSLKTIIAALPGDFPAAMFIVQHTSPSGPGLLVDILDEAGPLKACVAEQGEPFRRGCIYVAPPDRHLLLREGRTALSRGPRENRVRPAIDPLFRSAAVAFSSRVIGVILSGYLDDGASGLDAIKRCGGLAMVLDPQETDYPDMPLNALRSVEVDHCGPLEALAQLLERRVREPAPEAPPIPIDLELEVRIAEKAMSDARTENRIGEPSSYACPDCNGLLWKIDDPKVTRYRCNVGHSYTETALLDGQSDAVEKALWIALRSLEDRGRMLRSLADDAQLRGAAGRFRDQLGENGEAISQVRHLLLNGPSGRMEPGD